MGNFFRENWISKVREVDVDTNQGYTFDRVMNNLNCSKDARYWRIIKKTKNSKEPKFLFKSNVAESWEFTDPNIDNPIRNTNQIYLKFKKVKDFIAPSNHFRKHGCYTFAPEDTLVYERYWDDIEDKIENGFVYEGVRITGRHFFTINFGRFLAIPVDEFGKPTSKRKVWTFLRFIDIQFYIFHELEEVMLDGIYSNIKSYRKWFPTKLADDYYALTPKSFVASKARRKGWSAIIGTGIFNYNFTFKEGSTNFIVAGEKSHYGPIRKAIANTKSFIDKYTPWIRRTDVIGQREHMVASVKIKDEYGIETEEGYLSELKYESFKDNPFKSIGESAYVINIEEPGKFSNLLEAYPISIQPLLRDGETIIGSCIVGGTAGDLEAGGSEGIYNMMMAPEAYGFKGYENIYEENPREDKVGFFIDDLWYSPVKLLKSEILHYSKSKKTKLYLELFKSRYVDTVDEFGNSYRYLSKIILKEKRKIQKGTSITSYQKFITQQPLYLSEAFLVNETSPFEVLMAKEALGILKARTRRNWESGLFYYGKANKVKWKRDFGLNPIIEFPHHENEDLAGCWVLYQHPVKTKVIDEISGDYKEEIMSWRYIAGTDPIDFGTEETSGSKDNKHSLAATYIIDALTRNIVAEYIGRPRTSEEYFEQLIRGLEYYNAILLYENNLKGLFSYFKSKNKLYLLASEPDSLKDRTGYKPNNRIKGFHATKQINSHARELINRWTLEEVIIGQDENSGEKIIETRMFTIPSIGLLQEIIAWNNRGNYDRISGLGAAMLLLFDRDYEEEVEMSSSQSVLNDGIFRRIRNRTKKENPFLNFMK